MSTYTAQGSVWINAGGLVTCIDHGGDYLRTAVNNGECPHISTPLDDWLYYSKSDAAIYGLVCEFCAAD